MADLNMVEAIRLGLRQALESDDEVVVLGQDVGVDGGVFRVTQGLIEDFGKQRVIDTPLAESAIAGMAIGMALDGLRPICEMQFSGFSYLALNQLEAQAARLRWRSRGRFEVPMVVRMPYGGGVRALEHHCESREVYYTHTPGLKLVIPSGPRNARALLASAIADPDPVIFFESKLIYRAFREEVPDEEETMPLGESRIAREGDDLTLVSYGGMLHRALGAAETMADDDGVETQVIDLLTLSPLDIEPVVKSVKSTGRAVVVHEAHRSFGPAAEIIARLMEEAFFYLETPIERVTGFDVIPPYFAREQDYLPSEEAIVAACRRSLES